VTVEQIRVSPQWLDLREAADAAARSRGVVALARRLRPGAGRLVIHDLACGSGSMGRWLAPRLPGSQLWVIHDRDADLLEVAAANPPGPAADGAPVVLETRLSDITQLRPDDLAGASLITASALLDLITGDQLADLAGLCSAVGCPVLLTLSVVGRVELAPADPLDRRVASAFDTHQRRLTAGGRLLGPDAVAATAERFRRLGRHVLIRRSPWQLGAADADLAAEWLTGWLDAACGQEPGLAADVNGYAGRRLAQARAGQLTVTVDHADLLVLP
jgi:trans-aconitate methyltransferase